MDPLSIAAIAAQGLGAIIDLFKSDPEKAQLAYLEYQKQQDAEKSRQRAAAKKYLEENYTDFQAPEYKFDEGKFKDILDPMKEGQKNQQESLVNKMALSGQGRGGMLPEMMMKQGRQQQGDLNTKLFGLRREDEASAYQRAMNEYLQKMEKVKLLSQYQ